MNRMQQEQAGALQEGETPKTRTYCGGIWSTFAELLLQGNGKRRHGGYIVVGFDRGVGMDS